MPIEVPEGAPPQPPAKGGAIPIDGDPAYDRNSLAAELEAMDASEEATPAKESIKAEESDDGEEPKEKAPPEKEPAAEEEDGDDKPIPDESEDEDEEKPDPGLAKRLAAISRQEKRAKEMLARERAEIERAKADLAPRLKALEEFDQLAKRAKYDPVALFRHFGISDEDFDGISRELYAASKAGQADPKLRAASQRSLRERELAEKVERLEKAAQEREQRDQERERQAAVQREVHEYVEETAKLVSDDAPLVRTMLEKNPRRAREQLAEAAHYLYQKHGEIPDKRDVVKALEEFRRAELEEAGIDVDVVVKAKKRPAGAPTEEKKPSKTLSNDMTAPTKTPAKPMSKKEERDQLVRELEAMG